MFLIIPRHIHTVCGKYNKVRNFFVRKPILQLSVVCVKVTLSLGKSVAKNGPHVVMMEPESVWVSEARQSIHAYNKDKYFVSFQN